MNKKTIGAISSACGPVLFGVAVIPDLLHDRMKLLALAGVILTVLGVALLNICWGCNGDDTMLTEKKKK
jgi:hypothetical protein